jgi:hypothetical protein
MTVIAMTREIGSLGNDVATPRDRSEVAAGNVARRLRVAESSVTRYLDGSASLLERWPCKPWRKSRSKGTPLSSSPPNS